MPISAVLPMTLGSGWTAPSDTNTAVKSTAVAVSGMPDHTETSEMMPTATTTRVALIATATQSWCTGSATSRRGRRPSRSERMPSRTLLIVSMVKRTRSSTKASVIDSEPASITGKVRASSSGRHRSGV